MAAIKSAIPRRRFDVVIVGAGGAGGGGESSNASSFVGGSIVGDKEKSKSLSSAKFYVLTSRYEGLPITVLESLACGTPVIVSNATNTGSMVENNMLGFVAEDDVVSISNRISEAIKTSEDEYLNLSTRASKYALDNLSWKLIVEKHDINYEKY